MSTLDYTASFPKYVVQANVYFMRDRVADGVATYYSHKSGGWLKAKFIGGVLLSTDPLVYFDDDPVSFSNPLRITTRREYLSDYYI